MKFFVFATFFSMLSSSVAAQGFFIPGGAMMPLNEKLKPLDETLRQRANSYSQRLYTVRDGRVFAIEDEIPEIEEQENITFEPQEILPEENPEFSAEVEEPAVEIIPKKPVVLAPQTADIDLSLPPYKNRYALYLKDLEVFNNTKKMPQNVDLDATLSKVASPKKEVLFQGKVE